MILESSSDLLGCGQSINGRKWRPPFKNKGKYLSKETNILLAKRHRQGSMNQ